MYILYTAPRFLLVNHFDSYTTIMFTVNCYYSVEHYRFYEVVNSLVDCPFSFAPYELIKSFFRCYDSNFNSVHNRTTNYSSDNYFFSSCQKSPFYKGGC